MRQTNANWLTVDVVEDLQHAIARGKSVSDAVANLNGSTLPGIMEYGCLQHMMGPKALPMLPEPVVQSRLGRALQAVKSGLGLRNEGRHKIPLKNIDAQWEEFFVLHGECDLEHNDWELFGARLTRSAEMVGFSRQQASLILAALFEMAENAVIHADCSVPRLVGYRVMRATAQFCVADVGRGVLASLRSCLDYADIAHDGPAIRKALQDGISRYGRCRGGFGFRPIFKALTAQWGRLRFRSGGGCITMDGTALDADKGQEHFPPAMPGFQVTVTCALDGSPPPEPLL